jgi:hypothetical protein
MEQNELKDKTYSIYKNAGQIINLNLNSLVATDCWIEIYWLKRILLETLHT